MVESDEELDFYREQSKNGKTLYLYSCNGPGRTSDPYSYYRLQAWEAFNLGASGSGFWSFTGTGEADPWNEYLPALTVWTPLFLEKDDAITAKQLEAISESVGDFEYLTLLQEAVEKMRRSNHPFYLQARTLLQDGPQKVLSGAGAQEFEWKSAKDRSLADAVRIQIGNLLEKAQY